jgi:phage tail sheath protein FI
MPEYLSPGVYVEEIEIGAKPIEGVSTSTAGFLGLTERGPTAPRLVTGFEQFQRIYGGFTDKSYLAYAVDGFFRNGGQRCFIGRITRIADPDSTKNAVTASADLDTIGIDAIGPGEWGNNLAIKIEAGSLEQLTSPPDPSRQLFKLTVAYWSERPPTPPVDPTDRTRRTDVNRREPTVLEVYDNLSHVQISPDYYERKINGVSNLIKIRRLHDGRPANISFEMLNELPTSPSPISGNDGSNITVVDYDGKETVIDPQEQTTERIGLLGFTQIDELSILCAPDENSFDGDLTDRIVDHCEELKDRFAILQSPQDATPSTIGTTLRPPRDSKYAAFYYPWIKVLDPRTVRDKLIPPGGHVAGIYARSDEERGVHKAPANEIVRGATALQFPLTKGEQDLLNPIGVNVIRTFPARGIRVWGARTTSTDPLWKYINVRRLFLFIEESIDEGTQSFVFEPNDERLWDRVKQTITQFLTRVWRDGALMGTTPEQAFFVKVDRTTMTQDDIDNGRLIVLIGVAPVKPAEFVIFRIAQTRSGADVTEA